MTYADCSMRRIAIGLVLLVAAAMVRPAGAQEAPTEYELVDLKRTWTSEAVERTLGDVETVVVADEPEESLTFFARMSEAETVWVSGSIQKKMHRVDETELWTLAVRVPSLAQAVIGYSIVGIDANRHILNPYAEVASWRGSAAPKLPTTTPKDELRGRLSRHELPYDRGDQIEQRGISVYLPPAHDPKREYPVIYLADGLSVDGYAGVVEPLIDSGAIEPVVLVGVHCGVYEGDPKAARKQGKDRRTIEYLYGIIEHLEDADERAYETHERFVLDVVLPWAEQTWGASTNRAQRCIQGSSNGASFAVSVSQRHPDVFEYVGAFSAAFLHTTLLEEWNNEPARRYFVVAGAYEGNFKKSSENLAEALRKHKADHVFTIRFSGHDGVMWTEAFVDMLKWLEVARGGAEQLARPR